METEILKNKISSDDRRRDRLKKVAEDLRIGRKVTDFRFDQVYPPSIRKLSETHWTPVEVAIRAGELLAQQEQTRVLDVGSGCGKFCMVASLSGRGRFIGIEQRPQLLTTARRAAEELQIDRATFIPGNMVDLDWSFFDAFYLFNPFYEHIMKSIRIDEAISFNKDRFNRYVEIVRTKLKNAKPGTKVATYHGFGGDIPLEYERIEKEPIGTSYLELWVKLDSPKEESDTNRRVTRSSAKTP